MGFFLSLFLGLIVVDAGSGVAGAQDTAPVRQESTLRPDSSAVRILLPEDPTLQAYREDPDFQYATIPIPSNSWWEQFQRWLRETLFNAVSGGGWDVFWKILQYCIVAGLLIFGILQLLRMDARGLFYGKRPVSRETPESVVADIQEIDLLEKAGEAVRSDNYRLAVRLYYLQVLKMLDAQNLISWTPRKTNQDYVRECSRPALRQKLARMTYLFDHAWYGEFAVDGMQLREVQQIVGDLAKEIGGPA